MGLVRLCKHPRAKVPFFVEANGIHLYSIEELAYYLYENIYMIDDSFVGEKLYEWIEKQLELPKLAEWLRSGKSGGSHVYNRVMTILGASEYFSTEELAALSEKITMLSGLQAQERMKYKADDFCNNGKYWAAITEYEKILSIRQSTKLDVKFYANVWNNLGVCYGRLFLFRKAAVCFENAYSFHRVQEYRQKAYYAKLLDGSCDAQMLPKEMEPLVLSAKQTLTQVENESKKVTEEMTAEEFLNELECKYLKKCGS